MLERDGERRGRKGTHTHIHRQTPKRQRGGGRGQSTNFTHPQTHKERDIRVETRPTERVKDTRTGSVSTERVRDTCTGSVPTHHADALLVNEESAVALLLGGHHLLERDGEAALALHARAPAETAPGGRLAQPPAHETTTTSRALWDEEGKRRGVEISEKES